MALVSEIEDLLVEARSGNRRSLSRLLTLVEEGHNSPIERGIGSSLGITGPPGVGKSSLIGKMIDVWICLLYTSPSPRDRQKSRMPSSA